MFEPLPAQFDFPAAEKRVLDSWRRERIFERSLEQRQGSPRFVFYEGPPTANGLPHPGHALTRAIKDIFPRYRTMCGFLVERKAGWDTHGLPVEREVCKELGIRTKQEIEAYGVEKFNLRCIQSVFRYTREWEELTRRLGFWVNLEDAYVTFHQSYVESVWWSLKTLFERGVLYQGHKVVWWWAQGGTALSSGEVGEGYRTVDDPSVFVKFPLVEGSGSRVQGSGKGNEATAACGGRGTPEVPPKTSLLVWTTTPWTLISNHFAAVHPELEYALVHDVVDDEYLYIAAALVDQIAKKVKRELRVVSTCRGADVIGMRYLPPMVEVYHDRLGDREAALVLGQRERVGWRVVAADFVTLESGTGLVHEAPAYGEVDFNLLQEERQRFESPDAIPLLNAVNPDGTFNDDAPQRYRGRWVKDCDKDIIRELRDERTTPWGTPLLYHQEQYRHDYPFCPQAPDDPLIQYARQSWFVRTSAFKDEFLRNNAAVNWLPEHIKEGRFGDFLRNNVDWALSRERYWGTPLPIWKCERCGRMEAIGSFAELQDKPGATDGGYWERKVAEHRGEEFPEHLRVHKPYIDEWTYACTECDAGGNPGAGTGTEEPRDRGTEGGARMRRVPEVIDCWWDAGSMPFAQWGFPHAPGSSERFEQRFPADFISEAIDQTRGWFYGLLAISTLLFSESAMEDALAAAVPDSIRRRAERGLAAGCIDRTTHDRPIEVAARAERSSAMTGARATDRRVFDGVTCAMPMPFRTCIVLGHIAGEDGNKMSKKLRNYKEPTYIFDTYGADAMRWYFFSAQTPWTSVRFQEAAIRDSQREFLVKLYNVLSFFTIYANIDGFAVNAECRMQKAEHPPHSRDSHRSDDPVPHSSCFILHSTGRRPAAERSELDRWILSELHRTVRFVRESMDRFQNYPAAQRLLEFVDALSNWYVRRSRERFWRGVQSEEVNAAKAEVRMQNSESPCREASGARPVGDLSAFRNQHASFSPSDQDKWDAYNTLHECLLTLSTLIAPFTPFFAESMYQTLTGVHAEAGGSGRQDNRAPDPRSLIPDPRSAVPASVHLCDYPVADESLIDEALSTEMALVREIASLGRAARASAGVKEARRVRQPLGLVEIILARPEHKAWLADHAALIAEELNVKKVEFAAEADRYVSYQVVPNFPAIGKKYRALVPGIKAALGLLADPAAVCKALVERGVLPLNIAGQPVELTPDEVEIRLEARPGWAAAQGRAGVVVINTELTTELREEGFVREVIHEVQARRKALGLAFERRIGCYVDAPGDRRRVLERHADLIRGECLAERIVFEPVPSVEYRALPIEDHVVKLAIVPV
jgi:isoleucyl-tRNA synthetase